MMNLGFMGIVGDFRKRGCLARVKKKFCGEIGLNGFEVFSILINGQGFGFVLH